MRSAGRRVLVVDDDDAIRLAIADALELEGYEVDRAANGAEALDRVHTHVPNAILLDLMMPVMTGWEFLEACRSSAVCAGTPVLVMSAYHRLPEIARSLGVKACMAKPFDLEVLLGAVERLVRSSTS